MALSAVSSATITIGKLLAEETKYLWGVEDEVERLQTELRWMKSFLSLKDADVRQGEDERIRMWVAEIRELAYDAEDIVETFALKIKSKRRGGGSWGSYFNKGLRPQFIHVGDSQVQSVVRGFFNVVQRSAFFPKKLWLLHETKSNIEKILARIADLTRRLHTYGIKELADVHRANASNLRRELRQSYSYIDEENIVGLTNVSKEVATLLTKDCQCRVVSICGMGGSGKTTLAKKVFNRSDVRKEFVHFAWVYISQQFQKRKVWEQILSSFNNMDEELKKKGDDDVAKELSNLLKAKKCLVILDDVWSTKDWSLLSPAFQFKETQSKILITSRNKKVAEAANDKRSCCIYELKVLNEPDSWELFRKIAFRNISPDITDYSKLEDLGKEMVKRCAGLPLAIVVLGGTLTKYSSQEWKNVSGHVESYLKRDKDQRIDVVLALSFEELPSYLRPCFLYLSHFPEDYEIHVDKLIQLWVAEGLVSIKIGEEFVEDIAESYLVELVERFMIQVGKRDATFRIKTCRMHDLMRDLCLSKAKEENFLHIMDSSSSNKLSSRTVRRIVANRFPHVEINNVRSILFFDNESEEEVLAESCIPFMMRRVGSWEYIFNNFKLIRVLDFEGTRRLPKLPSDMGNLIHLRCLSFRGMEISGNLELPSSVGNLTCLQTLDLRVYHYCGYVCFVYVPNVLWRLEQLKHLYLPEPLRLKKHVWLKSSSKKEKLALHTLTKLQTLVNFNAEFCCAADLFQLISLRKLKLKITKYFNIDRDFKHLKSLSISIAFRTSVKPIDVAFVLSSCPKICKLSLKMGKIVKLPEYCNFSSDIAEIVLYYCELEEDPMPTLEKLPNLRILNLTNKSFIGKEMVCSPHGFPKLHSLTLIYLMELEEWKVDERAMLALHHLSIQHCVNLKKLPDRLMSITTLQELKIKEMPKQFKDKVKEGFQQVPSLIFQDIIYENKQEKETIVTDKNSDQNEEEIVSTIND